jgi:site-specific DNA recombinase
MDDTNKKGTAETAKRAVLYARVSGDDRGKDRRNLAGQLEMAREYSRRKGYVVVAEISEDDKGASGASFELAGLSHVLAMAEAGNFDVLVPREIDRLSRSLAKQLIVEEELRRAGVQIEYVLADYDATPEGDLMKNVRAVVAEYERLKINERMVRGRQQKVKAGNVMVFQRPPFGYRLGEVDGRSALVVHEPEAQTVRLIFLWYTEGDEAGEPMSLADIVRELTAMGTLTCSNSRLGHLS